MNTKTISIVAFVGLLFDGFAIYSKTRGTATANSHGQYLRYSGTYLDSRGGKLYLEVDAVGRLEGFYENHGNFGEVYGRFNGGTFSGFWLEDGAPMTCANERHAAAWGRAQWTFADEDGFVGAFGYCGDEPALGLVWNGRRLSG